MAKSDNGLHKINAIAYNGNLRDQLKRLHQMLGDEITNVASKAMDFGLYFSNDSAEVMKYLSKMISSLSIALIEARSSKKKLSEEEQSDYESIKQLTATLANLMDRLNKIIRLSRNLSKVSKQIGDEGMNLANQILDAQADFRNVRSSINAYGFLSRNPELNDLFEKETEK